MNVVELRQFVVALSPQLAVTSLGGCVSYPAVLIQQLKANDSSIQLDIHTSSWIGSIYGLSGIPCIFLPIIMQWKGRKVTFIITSLFLVMGWALSLTANSVGSILASESLQGLSSNSVLTVSLLTMTEMLPPKKRNTSMSILGISGAFGLIFTGILGRYLHFKTVSLIMLIPAVLAIAIAFYWPESPPWLAYKGRFEECEKSFIWLRGSDDQSIKELREMITAQKENISRSKREQGINCTMLWEQLTSRDFYTPSLHIFILLCMMYWSGTDVVLIYFMEMVQRTTHNEAAAFYATIVMYCIYFLGVCITAITMRKFKNKTVLLCSTSGVIVFLISATTVTLLQILGVLAKDSTLCMYCLLGFMMCNCLGLNAVIFYMGAELMPVKHRSLGGSLLIIFNCILYSMTQKISPYLFLYVGMCGTFTIFTVNAIICSLFVWRYVPETKGRTLQEIEDYYVYGKYIERKASNEYISINGQNGSENNEANIN